MVNEPRIRSEDIDAYKAGRFDEIRPEIMEEVKDLVARQTAKKPVAVKPNYKQEEPHEL